MGSHHWYPLSETSTNAGFVGEKVTVTFGCPSTSLANNSQFIGFSLSVTSDVLSFPPTNLLTTVMALPLSKIFKLRITLPQKIALGALFTIGFLYTGGEIIRLVEFVTANPSDALSPARLTLLYNPIQGAVAVVVGCIPILRPLFFRRKLVQTSSGPGSGSRSNGSNKHLCGRNDEESLTNVATAPATNAGTVEEHEMTVLKNAGVAPARNAPVEEHEIAVVKEAVVQQSHANIQDTESQDTESQDTELRETELHETELHEADVQETDMQEAHSTANSHRSVDLEWVIEWRAGR
jgi:hypothetical protein